MSGSMTTFFSGETPNAPVVIPVSTPTKLMASPPKLPPQGGAKSRVKNTPRRGKPPGSTCSLITQREPSLYTQANRNTPDAVPAIGRSVSTPSVPIILNTQPCNVLLVSETPPARVPSILVSGPTPQSTNVQTFISNAGAVTSRQAKIVYADAPMVYTTANSSQIVHSPASNPNASDEVKHEIVTPTSTFQNSKPKTPSVKPTKSRIEGQKNKQVRPKVHTQNSTVIDIPSTSANFMIPVNDRLHFHPDNSVGVPSSVGYTINITDILPPKPSPPKTPAQGPPKLKPAPKINLETSSGQTLPSVSAVTQKAQLLPKDTISVKSQSKMIAPQPTLKLPTSISPQSTSYIQFQTSSDSDDISVIPITILSSSSQQPMTLDSQGMHNTQFVSQVPVPQLVPYQTLAPSQGGSPSKLSKPPDDIGNASVESMDVVEVIDVTQDDSTLRTTESHIGELHHGLTKSVPEPYATDILSQLIPDVSLPAISSSQVSSVLSALDSPQVETQHPFTEQSKAQPEAKKKVPPLRLRRMQPKATAKQKTSKAKEEMKKEKQETSNDLVERVQCFKCRFCLFLTLDSAAVTKHIEEEHSSHLSKISPNGNVIPCPGCSNVFVSEKSLSVHLSEDHKVALRELNDIMSTLVPSRGALVEEESRKKGKQTKEKAKRPPRTSAKIRVRNLMKDAGASEKADNDISEKDTREERVASRVERNVEDDKPASVDEDRPARDDLDHDYASVFQGDSLENGNTKKRRRKKGGGNMRKKLKGGGAGNENNPRFIGLDYKCSVSSCGVRMRSYDNLVYHQRCHKKRMLPAAKCETDQEVTVVGSPESKDKLPSKSRKMEYSCPECSLVIRSWVNMSGHLWRSHNIDMELHSCDQCGYKTPSLSNMVNLHKRIHGSERPFACDSCDKSFKTTKQLRNHKIVHANQIKAAAGEASVCELCGRLFADARLLRSHISAVHNKLKPFTCPACGYAASSRSTLKMHMRLHTGEKPFACDVCSYTTADHNSLRRHKKRHSGEKPYKCPHCYYACIQSSTYKVHLRTKHPGQGEGLMFSCQSCPFHTVSYDIYRTHTAQHRIPARDAQTNGKSSSCERKQPKVRIEPNNEGNSALAVATAAVSDPLPIILSFSTDDAHASEAPNMHSVVEEVSEAIIPGSDLHLLYSNFAGFSEPQTTEVTAGVVYGSQTSDFVMSMLGDSVIQVVNERNSGQPPLVTLAEERITGDLGELQENTEDLKFKLCEEVRS